MKVHEKIKFLRHFRDWSQEEMADKLQMTPNGYAKIEQGKTNPDLPRLEQISEIFGVELAQLVGLNDKNVSNFIDSYYSAFIYHQHSHSHHNAIDQTTCKHELKTADLIIEQKDKEIEQKDKEVAYLKEIIVQKDKEVAYLKEIIVQKDKEFAYLKEMIEIMKKQA